MSGQMRRAAVIGAASGIGHATAERLNADGYELLLADVREDGLQRLASKLSAPSIAVDVANPTSFAPLLDASAGGLDAFVVTAGLSMSMGSFDRVLQVNLGGPAKLLEAFAPAMRPGGTAVLLSSIAGHLAGAPSAELAAALDEPLATDLAERVAAALAPEQRVSGMAYALSKLGVLRLAQRAATDWGARGLRVCSVSPGNIDTPMGALERGLSSSADAAVGLGPIPRLATAAEVANAIAFLCSTGASFITGCDLLVDGGWTGVIRSSPNSPLAAALAEGRAKS